MAKKQKNKGQGVARFLQPGISLDSFAQMAARIILEAMERHGRKRERKIALTASIATEENDHVLVGIRLTEGALALFPFVDAKTAAESDQKYFAKMHVLRGKYGDDIEAWPDALELDTSLTTDDTIVFSFYFQKLKNHEMSFWLAIAARLNGKHNLLKSRYDIDYDDTLFDIDDEGIITLANKEREIDFFLHRQVGFWLFNPDNAWQTALMRDSLSAFSDATYRIWSAVQGWGFDRIDTRYTGEAIFFQLESTHATDKMKAGALKTRCEQMLGSWFKPGIPVGFLLSAEVYEDGRLDITLRGPFAVNQRSIHYNHQLFDLSNSADLLFSETFMPRLNVDEVEERESELEFREDLDLRLAKAVLNALDIDYKWQEEEEE